MNKKQVAKELIKMAKELIVSRTPQIGDKVRFMSTDGLMTVDTIYDIFGTEIELDKTEQTFDKRKHHMKWRGNHWLIK